MDKKKEKNIDFSLYQSLVNEIYARDSVFRIKFNQKKRKTKPPFISNECPYHEKHMLVWNKLNIKDLTQEEALEEITKLMEEYYEEKYALRGV